MPSTRAFRALALFGALFGLLYWGYMLLPDAFLVQTVYGVGIVHPAAALIGAISPGQSLETTANEIHSGLNALEIVRGCDGSGALFLLWAAIIATPGSWQRKLLGLGGSLALLYGLNLLRIVILFFVLLRGEAWFTTMHSLVLPGLMILIAGLFYFAWSQFAEPGLGSKVHR